MSFIKSSFVIFVLLHGLIHLLGFIKAYDFIEVQSLSNDISKPIGWLWLLAALLFMVACINYGLNNHWTTIALIAIVVSQILVFIAWGDAKYGSIANLLIFIVTLISIMGSSFKNSFHSDATSSIIRSEKAKHETLVNNDIMHLPVPLQKYLHFADVVGKPKIRNIEIKMNGRMRSKTKDWFDFSSIQYNTFDKYERLFFMDAKVNKLPTSGYHFFKDGSAKMDVKILSAFPVVSESGELLRKAETVTLFNDMCLMAPASLIDKNIQWEQMNDNEVKATFTNQGVTISATLYFDNDGALVNFYSEDRMDINDKKIYGFSTPISDYRELRGYMVPTLGKAIWHYPEGEFVYGEFNIDSIHYNVKKVQE